MIKIESPSHYQNEPTTNLIRSASTCAADFSTWRRSISINQSSSFGQPSPADSNRGSSNSPNPYSEYSIPHINQTETENVVDIQMDCDRTLIATNYISRQGSSCSLNLKRKRCDDSDILPSEESSIRTVTNPPPTIPSSFASIAYVQSPVQCSLQQVYPPSPISRKNTTCSNRESDELSSLSICTSVDEGIGSEGTQDVSTEHETVYTSWHKRLRHDSGLGCVDTQINEQHNALGHYPRTPSERKFYMDRNENVSQTTAGFCFPATNVQESAPKSTQDYAILRMIPSLISEKHRKAAFVENLVDTAALIIEVVWSKFTVNPRARLIPMRVFLQQTLRRSRTSYSTLQTALFYLFRIKEQIEQRALKPRGPPTPSEISSETNGCHNTDPATCGRRMFLASLIIASKYLQDSNYSNRAWSKISGLPLKEINENEVIFLRLIDYKLFIAEDVFKRWSSLLLTHIQAISGSDMDNANAFRLKENQRKVDLFRETLRTMVI
jgi:hypothetical protein